MTKHELVVADAGPLIHLDELCALDVLSDFAAILVPDAVWNEVRQHRPQALLQPSVNLVKQPTPLVSVKVNAVVALYTLHHGEREALSLCLQHDISLLLTDDTAARLAAKNAAAPGQLRTPTEVLALKIHFTYPPQLAQ